MNEKGSGTEEKPKLLALRLSSDSSHQGEGLGESGEVTRPEKYENTKSPACPREKARKRGS